MKIPVMLAGLLWMGFTAATVQGQDYDFEVINYKVVGQDTLELHLFQPPDDTATPASRSAIVFFFGGGWVRGTPAQFYPHAAYFASRGMVAISAEYRVRDRHNTTPFESVADAKSAIRWVRQHADSLGVDPDKIVAAGGSAGGHIAATTGVINGHEDGADDLNTSSVPAAMILFNPVLDLTGERWRDRFPDQSPRPISPIHNVESEHPPTLIFHGTADTTVPIEQAQRFCAAMTNTGNVCRLMRFDGMDHAFFNYGRHGNKPYRATVFAADTFLNELGILSGEPTISP